MAVCHLTGHSGCLLSDGRGVKIQISKLKEINKIFDKKIGRFLNPVDS